MNNSVSEKDAYLKSIKSLLQTVGKNIEQKRKKFIIQGLKSSVMGILIFSVIFFVFVEYSSFKDSGTLNPVTMVKEFIYTLILFTIIMIISYIINFEKDSKEFGYQIKPILTNKIFSFFGKVSWQKSNSVVSNEILKSSLIFPEFVSRVDDDNFVIQKEDSSIKISEIRLLRKQINGKFYQTYNGVVINYEMFKSTDAHTIILPKSYQFKVPQGYSEVKIEDVNFMKKYKIYSTNQVEARYILTSAFIDRFQKLKTSFHVDRLKCSISGTNLLISLETTFSLDMDLFEFGNMYQSYLNIKVYERLYDQMNSILEIYNVLKLNTDL